MKRLCSSFLCLVVIMLDKTLSQQWWHWTLPCLTGVSATMSSPTSTPGGRKRGRNATPGTREFSCLMWVAECCSVSFSGLIHAMCVCVCDDSEQRRSHISSVSAPQRPWLLGWWPDADAHLACNRRPESGRSSGHLAVLQPSSLRFLQHDVHHVSRGWWDVAASKQVVFVFSLFVLVLPNEVDMSSPLVYGTPSSRVEGTPRSGVRGTPARQRPDLGSVRKAPQVDLHSEPVSACVCFKTD